jgi:hypothetical protein
MVLAEKNWIKIIKKKFLIYLKKRNYYFLREKVKTFN